MKHFCLLLFFYFFNSGSISAKRNCKRIHSKQTLAFATITAADGATTISDVDGKFSIFSKNSSFDVSYIGHFKTTVPVLKEKNFYAVFLTPKGMT
jgi:hypothetical protein